jgi:hypothetical protein
MWSYAACRPNSFWRRRLQGANVTQLTKTCHHKHKHYIRIEDFTERAIKRRFFPLSGVGLMPVEETAVARPAVGPHCKWTWRGRRSSVASYFPPLLLLCSAICVSLIYMSRINCKSLHRFLLFMYFFVHQSPWIRIHYIFQPFPDSKTVDNLKK